MSYAQLVLPYTPPSANRSRQRDPRVQHRMKKNLQRDIENLLFASGLPKRSEHTSCHATLRFPVRRRRDRVNYWLLDKALGDALVNGGWIPDDTSEHYSFSLSFDEESGRAQTVISIGAAP